MPNILTRWYRSDGDVVAAGEPLCEIVTEYAILEVEAPRAGILRRLKYAGQHILQGDVVARVEPQKHPSDGSEPKTS